MRAPSPCATPSSPLSPARFSASHPPAPPASPCAKPARARWAAPMPAPRAGRRCQFSFLQSRRARRRQGLGRFGQPDGPGPGFERAVLRDDRRGNAGRRPRPAARLHRRCARAGGGGALPPDGRPGGRRLLLGAVGRGDGLSRWMGRPLLRLEHQPDGLQCHGGGGLPAHRRADGGGRGAGAICAQPPDPGDRFRLARRGQPHSGRGAGDAGRRRRPARP